MVTPTITVSTLLSTVTAVDMCLDDILTATSTSTVGKNVTLSSLTTIGATSTVSTSTHWSNTTVSSTAVSTTTLTIFSTVTSTAVSTAVTTFVTTPDARRQLLTTSVPAYTGSCTNPGAYASACLCLLGHSLSASASTVTVTASAVSTIATSTTTVRVPSTTTVGVTSTSASVGGVIVTETTTSFITEIVTNVSTVSLVSTSMTSKFTTATSTITTQTTSTSVSTCMASHPVLASPTSAIPGVDDTLQASNSDGFFKISLPFPIKIYNVSSTEVFMAVNGILFLQDPSESPLVPDIFLIETVNSSAAGYSNTPLPSDHCNSTTHVCYASQLPSSYALAAFWDDLLLAENTTQGLWHEVVQLTTPEVQRSAVFEWYTTHQDHQDLAYHFTVQFFEHHPDWITVTYYSVGMEGISATVGVQGRGDGAVSMYSYNAGVIESGLVLDYNPATNGWEVSHKDVC
ncbi:hypothetical protein GE09DRAFT_1191994 [Coniochaeta sp. 2T2.1]|nr:hypothetical protein GE09DRAFT_1191994 [Coniochaeta sp. 2T2.1]